MLVRVNIHWTVCSSMLPDNGPSAPGPRQAPLRLLPV
jgi:hypothetical protein